MLLYDFPVLLHHFSVLISNYFLSLYQVLVLLSNFLGQLSNCVRLLCSYAVNEKAFLYVPFSCVGELGK